MGLLGFEEEDEEEEIAADLALEPSARFHPNVVELQPAKNMKLVVLGPKTYDDVQVIADHLRARRPVVVNLEGAQPEVRGADLGFSQRCSVCFGRAQSESKRPYIPLGSY